MPNSTAILKTNHASRYLQQLCKHFAHKIPVEFTPVDGRITLPFGLCTLSAQDSALTLIVTGEDDKLEQMEQVITNHLARFAFRENIALTWQRAG
ncbi:MAG: DUF2218 domain-containing protein [Asticcacaulis sp.]